MYFSTEKKKNPSQTTELGAHQLGRGRSERMGRGRSERMGRGRSRRMGRASESMSG